MFRWLSCRLNRQCSIKVDHRCNFQKLICQAVVSLYCPIDLYSHWIYWQFYSQMNTRKHLLLSLIAYIASICNEWQQPQFTIISPIFTFAEKMSFKMHSITVTCTRTHTRIKWLLLDDSTSKWTQLLFACSLFHFEKTMKKKSYISILNRCWKIHLELKKIPLSHK